MSVDITEIKKAANEAMKKQMLAWGFTEGTNAWGHLFNNACLIIHYATKNQLEGGSELNELRMAECADLGNLTPEIASAVTEAHNGPLANRFHQLSKPDDKLPAPFTSYDHLDTALSDTLRRIGARAALDVLAKQEVGTKIL